MATMNVDTPEPISLQPHSNIFVRNFPPNYNLGKFQGLFRQFGLIEGCRYFNNATIPYAFIKLASTAAAHAAIKELHNTKLEDRTIIVKSADHDAEYEPPNNNLFCINLPLAWGDDQLSAAFAKFGNVLSTRILPARQNMPSKGGLVRMSTMEEARSARDALNAITLPSEPLPLVVKYADSPEEKNRKVAMKSKDPSAVTPGKAGRFSPYGGKSKGSYSKDGGMAAAAFGQGGWNGGAGSATGPPGPTNVIVKNLPLDIDRLQLYELFAPFGGTMGVVLQGPGSAHVTYADAPTAARATQAMNGWAYRGMPLSVALTFNPPTTMLPPMNAGIIPMAPPGAPGGMPNMAPQQQLAPTSLGGGGMMLSGGLPLQVAPPGGMNAPGGGGSFQGLAPPLQLSGYM